MGAAAQPRGRSREALADQIIRFAERHKVGHGTLIGRPLELLPYQRDWINRTWSDSGPRVRSSILSLGRKNGKTALTAAIGLAYLYGPLQVANAEFIAAARKRDQAAKLFDYALKMARISGYSHLLKIRESVKILQGPGAAGSGLVFQAISADAAGAHGGAPIAVCHDELGQVRGPRDRLYDALNTSLGAFETSLEIILSTQAEADTDLLSLLIDDALSKVDPRAIVTLYTADPEADPWSVQTWEEANPALGIFRSLPDVEELAAKARRIPSRESTFRNLILNQRVALEGSFLSANVWKANCAPPDLDVFRRCDVYGGLDLSSRKDLTALVLVCEDEDGQIHVLPYFWTPAGTLLERAHADRAPYDRWHADEQLIGVPGQTISFEWVAAQIGELTAGMQLASIGFDRYRIEELKRELARADLYLPLNEVGQGYKSMTPAVEAVEHAALAGELRHGGHPVLTWCIANARVQMDPAGNRKLDKLRSFGRIDGAVALAMALYELKVRAQDPGQGILFI